MKETADTVGSKEKPKGLKDFGNPASFLLMSTCLAVGTQGLEHMRGLRKPKQYTFDEKDQAAIDRAREKRERKANRRKLEAGRRANESIGDGDTNAGKGSMEEGAG